MNPIHGYTLPTCAFHLSLFYISLIFPKYLNLMHTKFHLFLHFSHFHSLMYLFPPFTSNSKYKKPRLLRKKKKKTCVRSPDLKRRVSVAIMQGRYGFPHHGNYVINIVDKLLKCLQKKKKKEKEHEEDKGRWK